MDKSSDFDGYYNFIFQCFFQLKVVGGSEASKRRPPTKKKVKLIKKKRLKKKPSTEGSDGGGESTTAEGGSEGENNGLHECWSGQIQIPVQRFSSSHSLGFKDENLGNSTG